MMGARMLVTTPGLYCVTPPPDLNDLPEGGRFAVEYDYPILSVRGMATKSGSEKEKGEAILQARLWERRPNARGYVGYDRTGYQFNQPSSTRARGHRHQFIPDISYVDGRTWSALSPAERNRAYLPCVPSVVIQLVSKTNSMPALQAKVTTFIHAGTREGVVVDTRHNRVWIYNRQERPFVLDVLAPIEFDSWPEFTLDCLAIRDARTRAGLE